MVLNKKAFPETTKHVKKVGEAGTILYLHMINSRSRPYANPVIAQAQLKRESSTWSDPGVLSI